MVCPNCGTENENRNVCLKCGSFLNNKVTQKVSSEEQKKLRKKRVLAYIKSFFLSFGLILVAFIVLSIIMFVVFYFVFDKLDLDLPEESTSDVTDEADASETTAAQAYLPLFSESEVIHLTLDHNRSC